MNQGTLTAAGMTARLCGWHECQAPLIRREGETASEFCKRETCCQSHGSKLGRLRAALARESGVTKAGKQTVKPTGRPKTDDPFVPWPRVTGTWPASWEKTKPFKRHNLAEPKCNPIRLPRPDTRSYIGCSAAELVRSAVS